MTDLRFGLTEQAIETLDCSYNELLKITNKTLDFIICIETSNISITPNIRKIEITIKKYHIEE